MNSKKKIVDTTSNIEYNCEKSNSGSKEDELENCLRLFKDSLFFYNYVAGNRTSERKTQVESNVFITMGH